MEETNKILRWPSYVFLNALKGVLVGVINYVYPYVSYKNNIYVKQKRVKLNNVSDKCKIMDCHVITNCDFFKFNRIS